MAGAVVRGLKIRHLVLFVLCLMYFIAYIDRVNISVAAPALRKELGLTPTQLGLIFSAFAYPYAAMQVVGGWASDRFVLFRILVGVGEGGAFPTATRAFMCWLPVQERGFAQGITHSFARLGGAVTPPIVLAIVVRYGWREADFTCS
jgi:sugar phosphate permease